MKSKTCALTLSQMANWAICSPGAQPLGDQPTPAHLLLVTSPREESWSLTRWLDSLSQHPCSEPGCTGCSWVNRGRMGMTPTHILLGGKPCALQEPVCTRNQGNLWSGNEALWAHGLGNLLFLQQEGSAIPCSLRTAMICSW